MKFEISFFNALVLCGGKNFYKNIDCSPPQNLMLLGLRLFSQLLALSFNVKEKSFMRRISKGLLASQNVEQISSNSLIWEYGISFFILLKMG